MDTTRAQYRVHQCSKCSGDTEYYCVSCQCDLCRRCEENHFNDLKTIDHSVVKRKEKHLGNGDILYSEHETLYARSAYQWKRQQHRETIHTIRSGALFYRPVLKTGIIDDINTCQKTFSIFQLEIKEKAQRLKKHLDKILRDVDFIHRCHKQRKYMRIHIASILRYLDRYEKSAIRPIQFLSSVKTTRLSPIHLPLHISQISITESLKKVAVMELLIEIKITERGNRCVEKEHFLKPLSKPELHHSLTVTGADGCYHISRVSTDHVFVSDRRGNLILTNTKEDILYHLTDICSDDNIKCNGLHTVNNENELIYIDGNYDIKKQSNDKEKAYLFIKKTDLIWEPQCVYWSQSTGDLLVAQYRRENANNGKVQVVRYNYTGQENKAIQHKPDLYSKPCYITENNNEGIVVSDYGLSGAVVVIDRRGYHRFSYKGHRSGSGLRPRGICTDALSHILVCDGRTDTVQMINKDGKFLSHILVRPPGIIQPYSLSYDVNTHRLWVGSEYNNKICVYRYLTRQDPMSENLTEERKHVSEEEIPKPSEATGTSQEGTECLQKLKTCDHGLNKSRTVSEKHQATFDVKGLNCQTLHVHRSIRIPGIENCNHISLVMSNQIWVNDRRSLILWNTYDGISHQLKDIYCGSNQGSHTVNSEGELIYIDRNYNINKLSKDMLIITTVVKRENFTWLPRCVYWSSRTGDILVGMFSFHKSKGMYSKFTRFNQTGHLTQAIQHDSSGLEIYSEPSYITENNNGDVIMSDWSGAVVVINHQGNHRFSYTGHPPGSGLKACGVCTDEQSHILVCDRRTDTVHQLDRDGRFLSILLIDVDVKPCSLCYDFNTNRLLIGLESNKVCEYGYITKSKNLTGECPGNADNDDSSSPSPSDNLMCVEYS